MGRGVVIVVLTTLVVVVETHYQLPRLPGATTQTLAVHPINAGITARVPAARATSVGLPIQGPSVRISLQTLLIIRSR